LVGLHFVSQTVNAAQAAGVAGVVAEQVMVREAAAAAAVQPVGMEYNL
jgi:hypothetical protein